MTELTGTRARLFGPGGEQSLIEWISLKCLATSAWTSVATLTARLGRPILLAVRGSRLPKCRAEISVHGWATPRLAASCLSSTRSASTIIRSSPSKSTCGRSPRFTTSRRCSRPRSWCQVPQIADRLRRYEARLQQSRLQQLAQPRRIAHVRFSAGDVSMPVSTGLSPLRGD